MVVVDLAGPISSTPRGNSWILVLTDYFTRWAGALAIPDASAPMVARVLDQHVFCYFGLPEQIHSDQGAQFQSQLMSDLAFEKIKKYIREHKFLYFSIYFLLL